MSRNPQPMKSCREATAIYEKLQTEKAVMNWFRFLQSIANTAEWRERAAVRECLQKIRESANEADSCLARDNLGTFSMRQASEAMKELEGHFAELAELKQQGKAAR